MTISPWKTTLPLLAAASLVNSCCGCPPVPASAATGGGLAQKASLGSEGVKSTEAYDWKSVITLGGGFVTGIIFNATEKDLLYARTDIGGAYRYNPADQTWIPLMDMLGPEQNNFMGVESLATDPVDPNRVYMAVGTYTQSWQGNGAIMRSTDRGKTWDIKELEIKFGGNENGRGNGERMVVDPHKNDIVLLGTRKYGLWRTDDAGDNWGEGSFPAKEEELGVGITFVLFDPASGKPGEPTPVVYAGFASKETGLYESADNGKNWKPVPGQPEGVMPSHAGLDADGMLYLSYGDTPGPSGMREGAIWKVNPKTDKWTEITPLKQTEKDKFGYGGLSVLPSKKGTVLVTTIDRWGPGDEVFRTSDGGKTWQNIHHEAKFDDSGAKYLYWGREDEVSNAGWMADVAIDPHNPARAMYVTGQGIWHTDTATEAQVTAVQWTFRNLGLEETAVKDLASPPSGPPLLSSLGDLGGFRHDDLFTSPQGGMFQNPIYGNGSSLDFAEAKPEVVVRAGSRSHDSKATRGAISSDGGATWEPFATDPAGNGLGQIIINADATQILWAPKDAPVVLSGDAGKSWTDAPGLPEAPKLPGWAPVSFKIAADRVNPNKYYVYDAMGGSAFYSHDGAQSFDESKTGLPARPEYGLIPTSINAVPSKEGHAWVSTGEELYRTTDSGQTYQSIDGLSESAGIGFGKAKDGTDYPALYFVGKVSDIYGIYRSDDEGTSWVRINTAEQQFGGANQIIGDPRVYGRAYIGTHGRGILVGEPQ